MRSKKLLLELIEYLDLFEDLVPDPENMGVRGFLTFVDSLLATNEPAQVEPNPSASSEVWIARHLSLLHRFSRAYIKRALAESECLQTEEEYTYLVCLMSDDGLTKTELNSRNGMEKTSGSEVIRRLRKYGLVTEQPDDRDKRSVRVYITPLGRRELAKVFPKLHLAAGLLSAPLMERQRSMLRLLLQNLVHEHALVAHRLGELDLEGLAQEIHRPEL